MKVAHVVRQYLPSVGGMEDVVANLVQYQHHYTSYEPTVISLDRLFTDLSIKLQAVDCIDGITIRRLPFFGSTRYPICMSILDEIKDYDIVHVHGVDFFYDFLALTKFIHRKKIIASTHGGFFHTKFAKGFKNIFFNSVTRFSSSLYNYVIACSDNDYYIFSKIVSAEKLRLIENGVDINKFNAAALRQTNRTIIYFGRWSVNKGIPDLLQLFSKLQLNLSDLDLIIAGRPYDIGKNEIDKIASGLNINDLLVVESPSNLVLKDLISQASFFCCLSRHEGFGLAAIEAMSAGLVPILSSIPPFEKIIRESSTGAIVANDEIEPILNLLSTSDDTLHKMKLTALEFSRQYMWENVAKKYMIYYE